MKYVVSFLSALLMTGTAQAQVQLSLVEGAVCAQNSAYIEELEQYNKQLYSEIGELQASSVSADSAKANALLLHYERMVAFRATQINKYEVLCSRASMPYSDFRKVCSPLPSGVSFAETVFCKPLKEGR